MPESANAARDDLSPKATCTSGLRWAKQDGGGGLGGSQSRGISVPGTLCPFHKPHCRLSWASGGRSSTTLQAAPPALPTSVRKLCLLGSHWEQFQSPSD